MGGLTKESRIINFAGGTQTKVDPFQLQLGDFQFLYNVVLTEFGLIAKRNGFTPLAIPIGSPSFITTYNQGPVAIGNIIEAYTPGPDKWISQGSLTPLSFGVLPVVRSNTSQTQVDSAIAPNGLMCVVYTDQTPSDLTVKTTKYSILDSLTGQVIIPPTVITNADSTYPSARVFILGLSFVIVFSRNVASTYHLQYMVVSSANPAIITVAATDISSSYTPATTVAFDACVLNNFLYVAWNGAGASGVKMATIGPTLQVSGTVIRDASHEATMVSVTPDEANQLIYVSYYNLASTTGYAFSVSPQLALILAPTAIIPSGTVLNLTSSIISGVLNFIYEIDNNYGYDSAIPTHYVNKNTMTSVGVVGTAAVLSRSVGLGSKSFVLDGVLYFLASFQSPYQPTYFLMNLSGQVVAKLAYSNGGGYLATGLPNVSLYNGAYFVGYLFKDLVQSVNKDTAVPANTQTAGIYAQTGVNIAAFTFGTDSLFTVETGRALNITGGFLWSFDGSSATEQGFFVWPDSIKVAWTETSTQTPTADLTIGSNILTALSAVTGVFVGMTITGVAIPAGTTIIAVGTTTLTLSAPVTASHATETVTIQGHIASKPDSTTLTNAYWYIFTYEWSDNAGNIFRSAPSIPVPMTTTGTSTIGIATLNVPTLRLSYKTNVKICCYRYSVAQPVYYQVSSILYPTMNSTTVDYITFVDTLSDASILGNNELYTTGGVVQNIGGNGYKSIFVFDDRLLGIRLEDRNLIDFSNQVLSTTPVELSDELSYYVAPNIGAQGNTGPLECGVQMDDKAILFKASAIYYFNGAGPDITGANNQFSQPIFITSTVGCSNQKSLIFQPEGMMFEFKSEAGNQIWILGRDLSTKYIGADVEGFTRDATVESAINIPGTNQVRFTLSSGVTLMYDFYYKKWAEHIGVGALSSTLYNGLQLFINQFGQVLYETPGFYQDNGSPVLMSFLTGWLNLVGLQGYQRVYYFFLLGKYLSPHKLQVQIASDFNQFASQSAIYSPNNYTGTYGSSSPYGTGIYGGNSQVEQIRVNLTQQRCQSFQIQVNEIFDSSLGVTPGAGLTLSGINLVFGAKKTYPKLPAANSVG